MKKYRDISVGGKKYGWTVRNDCEYNVLCIWENKKIIQEHVIAGDHIITPIIIAELIKDPNYIIYDEYAIGRQVIKCSNGKRRVTKTI